jgi:hypothetical protein
VRLCDELLNRNSVMRDIEAAAWSGQGPWRVADARRRRAGHRPRAGSGAARAADDDDDDDKTFEEKIIENIMAGVGATNMENKGIEYRERSPLVVPPSSPCRRPPRAKSPCRTGRRIPTCSAQGCDRGTQESSQGSQPIPGLGCPYPDPGRTRRRKDRGSRPRGNEPIQPGANNNPMLSPAQLGYTGGLMGMFRGNTTETAPFTGEPTRQTLTQPPTGYQTPSPNFAYGTGPKESLNKNYDVMSGKER